MSMNKGFMTKADLNEAAKLEKRKQYEEERKKRIFNAKQRLYGLDLDALERQIADKSKLQQIEAEYERRYEQQADMIQKVVHNKELELEKRKRMVESDINYYRCRFQRKEQRREYDLNDPDSIKKSQPVRIADDDFSLGISSAQIFNGEDLGQRERQQKQREQQRAWLDQQILERKRAEESRLQAEKALQESIASRDQRLEDMANSERKVRNQIVDSIRQYNCQMAQQKKQELLRKKQEKNEDDMAEIYNMLTSDILTENPDVAQSKTNPNKKIAFMYRGMTAEELEAFRKDQQQQMLDKKKEKTEQQIMEKQWEQYALNMDRELRLKDLEMNRKKQREFEKVLDINDKLAKEQRQQKDLNNRVLNRNEVSKEFYEQFNKTSR
ncbi:RIB43A-like with coiled-coils protein 2 [Lucilia cuprina]|uniref:RIB43A-like with coiled-coils protein 2 n=1 Tax=Lucilia cuprina TaxID=7375 RepID=UPI001F069980|nr:RIB43A-like with coiled-coils protein 2 [Lucilia cuprina]